MKLQTTVAASNWTEPISHGQAVFLMGSCFTENIGLRLDKAGFHTTINPHGITFNPISICQGIQDLIEGRSIEAEELVERDGVWQHWDFHSALSGLDKKESAKAMTKAISEGREALQAASHLILTLGTAWVYELADSKGAVVNNCHKFPAGDFKRRRLGTEEIYASISNMIVSLQQFNPGIQLVFTLSPVRHWKDGAEDNSVSKASLRLAIDQLCSEFAQAIYFPAYEILMDELRDYRFYADDMLHPNRLAQEIIWERFTQAAISEKGQAIAKEVESLNRMKAHRSLHSGSSADIEFKEKLAQKEEALKRGYPEVYLG